ncbi:MAG: hypothetical protein M3Y54_02605 [Bacteroidota bacterium]|nr:hypothetical protein [Bacteroidota bacterium]
MATTQELLQEVTNQVTKQLAEVGTGNRVAGVPSMLFPREKGILELLRAAEQSAPSNSLIAQARNWMENCHTAHANPVRNLAQSNPGSAQVGSTAAYQIDMRQLLNFVQSAHRAAGELVPEAVNNVPANRAGWGMDEWQRNDAEGLAAEMKARSPLFMKLYKQAYGHDWQEQSGRNRAN